MGYGKTTKSVEEYFKKNNVVYRYITTEYVSGYDYLLKSPGIPLSHINPRYKQNNVPIISDIELFYLIRKENNIISVTGTNGKTTIATLLNKILEKKYKVVLCGNIGIPIMDFIETKADYFIVETSSFMLEATTYFCPYIHIISNITKHHLEHHGNYRNYYQAKLKPLKNLNLGMLIYNYDDVNLKYLLKDLKLEKYSVSINEKVDSYIKDGNIVYNNEVILDSEMIKDLPKFQQINFMIAVVVAKLLNIPNNIISEELLSYEGLPFRLQLINKEFNIYNDSKATSPDATINALEFLKLRFKEMLLILGGVLQISDYSLIKRYQPFIKKIAIYGENKNSLADLFQKTFEIKTYENLDVLLAQEKNDVYDAILFSPASQSFDQFANYIERGNYFNDLIKKYY